MQLDACCFFRGPWREERKVRKTSSTPCARHTKKVKKKKKAEGDSEKDMVRRGAVCFMTGEHAAVQRSRCC